MLGFVNRSSRNLISIKAIKSVYFSLVRSRLEYAAVVWSPIFDVHINKIDKVQHKFLKFLVWKIDRIYPKPGSDKEELCRRFKMLSLKDRRLCASAIFLTRLIQGKVDCPRLLESITFRTPTWRSNVPFQLPLTSTNFAASAPIYRLMYAFNLFYKIDNSLDIYTINNVGSLAKLCSSIGH
ncbi:uncharacterized protein LOC123273411 [Cotesia glomerata]|uniref:uncharacterized protein LOC123273411 n=1 Tax=Cotesia glomerata TaxID=32391 RepID=UPI001D02DE15|nr:uncharacterized protein LOC123273411 [Cotesia glomerata]